MSIQPANNIKLSPEELDDLCESVSSLYFNTHEVIEQLIIETLARLPKEIREFVCDHCRFLSIGRSANAVVLNGSLALPFPLNFPEGIRSAIELGRIEELLSNPPKLILLSELMIDKYEQEDVISVVAHEIAHAYLGHEPCLEPDFSLAAEREVEACALASQWGFSGRGTDAEECAGYFTDGET